MKCGPKAECTQGQGYRQGAGSRKSVIWQGAECNHGAQCSHRPQCFHGAGSGQGVKYTQEAGCSQGTENS